MRVLAMVVLAGCRIGFDPVASPDAGVDRHADASPSRTCIPGSVCSVECPIGAPCVVDCAGAVVCSVQCNDPAAGCTVINCGPTCDLECGGPPPIRTATTASCP